MNVQFKKGVLELCVLVLVSRRDYYGYELVHEIAEAVEMSEGTMYPLLRRLTKDGFFTTYLRESNEGPPRKYYSITNNGRERMKYLYEEWHFFVRQVNHLID